MHSLWFFVTIVPFFKVETHALSVEVTCTLPFCGELADSASLEDFAQRSCAPTIQQVVDNLCDGAHHAYMVGLMLAIVFCMNVMLQGAAVYSFNYYMTSSMRKKYRKLGVILQCIGIFFVVAVLGIYYAMVIIYLSGVKLKGLHAIGIGAGQGANATYGYFLMWVSCLMQVAAILLSVLGARSSQEELIEEAREQAKFAAEMGGFGEVELPTYGQNQQQGMQFGMQPQMQPQMQMQFGMQPQGMGGFPQPSFQQQGFGGFR